MCSKNRLIQSLIKLVPDYIRSKCERHETEIQRVLQAICCRKDLSLFDSNPEIVTEFLINVRELLRTCDNQSNLGWKGIDLVKHLSSSSSICELLFKLHFVPVLSQYLQVQLESDKAVLLLSLLETLTDGIIVDRSAYWLSNTIKYLSNAILEKSSDYILPHLIAVLSNLCFENYIVVNELERETNSEDLQQFLSQFQTENYLVQLHASQVVFSILAMGSIKERMLTTYLTIVLDMLPKSLKDNNINLMKRCCCILLWMTRDRLILDLLKANHFQKLLQSSLQSLVTLLTSCQHSNDATNCLLFFTTKLLRTDLIVNKEFTEAFIPALIPLLKNAALNENLLELMADLTNIPLNLSIDEENLDRLVVNQVNEFRNPACKKSCKILGYALQILKKLYKIQTSGQRISLMLKPETFVKIVSLFMDVSEEVMDPKHADLSLTSNPATASSYSPESRIIVVQCLTLFGDITFRERDKLPIYSDLLAKPNVQQCLASAIVLSDCQIKQDALSLIGTVGFNRESLAGLSHAMDQLYCRCGSVTEDKEHLVNPSILNVTMSPKQIKKLDKITQCMQQDKFWETMKNCDVIELMELQLARREREELRLLHQLNSYKQELDSLKINIMQIGSENARIMTMLLSKTQLIENTELKNRGLSRRIEKMNEIQKANALDFTREHERLLKEKDRLELHHTEMTNSIQSQYDAATKQIRNLIQKNEDADEELKKSKKSYDALKLAFEKKSKEFEKLSHEFQEIKISSDNLVKSLRKKEKENEDKDREIVSMNQTIKKSEMVREDLEARLIESEKSCQETKKQLTKLEKIQEFIYDLSSGKNKLFEDK